MIMPWLHIRAHTQHSFADSEPIVLFGTLAIISLEKFLMNSCKEVITALPMLTILSNILFRYVIPPCSSSSKVLYFYSILLINAPPQEFTNNSNAHSQLKILIFNTRIVGIPLKQDFLFKGDLGSVLKQFCACFSMIAL